MNYTETLNFIHSFKGNGRRPQLKRMRWLLKQAGNPQMHYPTVHIVGTNGKGSTTSYLQNILTKSGYQVGTFTSPYITRFNERISINGTEIPDKDLINIVEKARVLLNDLENNTDLGRPTEFELVTLLMFLYFDLKQVDIAIIEAGIGGQLDSTNVLSPELVICTSISFDHTETLGDSLIDIARHKAGVMRENTPILLGRVSEEVSHLFKQKSQELQAPIANIDREIQLLSTDNQTLRVIDFCFAPYFNSNFNSDVGRTSPRSCRVSAIWTEFQAAPLRRLSETTHMCIPFSASKSLRIRPTKVSRDPTALTACG